MPLAPASTLPNLLAEWQMRLQAWALDGSLTAAAQEALGLRGEPKALADLVAAWTHGNFSALPPVVLLSSADIKGALGAYAISTGTIYLNADWLERASKEQIYAVLTEELGHHLDGLLNEVDTPGDEGEVFAGALLINDLTALQQPGVYQQDDRMGIFVNSEWISAEASFASSQKSTRISIGSSWGSSSYIYLTINGTTVFRQFYSNGKDSWSASEVAAGIRDLVNASGAGAAASISLDDPKVVIAWSNVVNGPLAISYTTGTHNYPAGSI
ncbi:hypothetical protein KQ300_10820, partial [Synechococcus sp. CS-1331]|nr:hypothetical protein [Synechococcus sp. CS-1331]